MFLAVGSAVTPINHQIVQRDQGRAPDGDPHLAIDLVTLALLSCPYIHHERVLVVAKDASCFQRSNALLSDVTLLH
eukprot:CAMPEP_0171846214 /NCGR_PEP_ID=MMETSP0992-20121227/17591_1 /TAXON_ID=483369 /ORGANISM="non described non described, Strain CCMP2098" /LENGTH=75 /DNA_ID=CAMNT_0012464477 /DNA_START=799 /DNA_END=1026 /DNA_ORIENTATION=+